MAHSTVNAKGEFVVFDDDGKKMTKKALRQQSQEQVETRHPLGLYVTSDEDGTRHFWRGDDEITEDVWTQQHPYLKRGNSNGRNGSSDSGLVGNGDASIATDDSPEGQVRQGIRDQRRIKIREAEAQRAGSPGDELGQPEERPEPA